MSDYFKSIETGTDLSSEARDFLKTLSPKRGEIMIKAMRAAMDGSPKMLGIVREMRATPCQRLDSVETSDYELDSDGFKLRMRLYARKDLASISTPAVLYVHGGGWTIGNIESCADVCQKLAESGAAKVVALDYRLAPEFSHPAPIRDCINAFDWICKNANALNIDSRNIFAAGDSAGGHLVLSTAEHFADTESKIPSELRGLILYYPVASLENRGDDESWRRYGKGFALDSDVMDVFTDAYLEKKTERPKASPLNFKHFSKYPPVLLFSSGCDILCNQDEDLSNKMRHEGVKLRYICLKGATHIYMTMPGMPESFATAFNESVEFIKRVQI